MRWSGTSTTASSSSGRGFPRAAASCTSSALRGRTSTRCCRRTPPRTSTREGRGAAPRPSRTCDGAVTKAPYDHGRMSSPLARSVAVLLLGAAATLCSGAAAAPLTPPIVFSADRAPWLSGEIYRLDADGRLVDLSNSPFTDTSVVVSPDGKSVAFRSFRGEGGVYVAAVDGSRVQQLETPPVGVNFDTGQVDLAWAPDSRRLAMVSGHGAAASLTVVGRGRVPVLLARKLVFQPAWSPDGRLVTGFVGRGINAYRATGGLAWRAPTSDFVFVPWSKRGLFLTV